MSEKRLYALRGAARCENTEEDIRRQVSLLYDTLLEKNRLAEEDIVSVIFSKTGDLDALNPAAALRQTGRAGDLALFAVREAETVDALPRVIRVLIHCYLPEGTKPRHVYRNGAEVLRPDRADPDPHYRSRPAREGQRGAESIWNSPPEETSEKSARGYRNGPTT